MTLSFIIEITFLEINSILLKIMNIYHFVENPWLSKFPGGSEFWSFLIQIKALIILVEWSWFLLDTLCII